MSKEITQDFFPISPVLRSSHIWSHLGKFFNFSEKEDHRNTKLQPEKKHFILTSRVEQFF